MLSIICFIESVCHFLKEKQISNNNILTRIICLNRICPLIWKLFVEVCKAHPERSDLCKTFWISTRSALVALIIKTTSHGVQTFVDVSIY